MQKKIAIITSGHPPYDERIFWKFGLSLNENNYSVSIICSTEEVHIEKNNILVTGFDGKDTGRNQKIKKLQEYLNLFSPDIIICCESLTIIPALRFKFSRQSSTKIIYDVTEWYPEGITSKIRGIKKYFIHAFLFTLNLILANLASAIIIGEVQKLKRYNIITPFKKKVIIGYYPVLKFFEYNPPSFKGNSLVLCYAGLINFKRGIREILQAAQQLRIRHNELTVKLKIIGRFESPEDEILFDKLANDYNEILIEKAGWTEYPNISGKLSDVDICFDLRERNFVYNNSLPIKIFEYMASGKPFIFSDVLPIRQELGEINCGFLVNPNDPEDIINKIELYISNPSLLKEHSQNGRQIIESGKNWESESVKLLELLK